MGVTTGRIRKTNWLNLDKLISAINTSGTTIIVVSKIDVMEKLNLYKIYHNSKLLMTFSSLADMKKYISDTLSSTCQLLDKIVYSDKVELTTLD